MRRFCGPWRPLCFLLRESFCNTVSSSIWQSLKSFVRWRCRNYDTLWYVSAYAYHFSHLGIAFNIGITVVYAEDWVSICTVPCTIVQTLSVQKKKKCTNLSRDRTPLQISIGSRSQIFRLGGVGKELQSTRKERKDPPQRKTRQQVDEDSKKRKK